MRRRIDPELTRPAFTRQLALPPFIVDLACRQARLAVELDGSQHLDEAAYDQRPPPLPFSEGRVLTPRR